MVYIKWKKKTNGRVNQSKSPRRQLTPATASQLSQLSQPGLIFWLLQSLHLGCLARRFFHLKLCVFITYGIRYLLWWGDVGGHRNLWTRLQIMWKSRDDHGRTIKWTPVLRPNTKRTATIHQKKKNNSTHLRKKLEELKIFDAVNITGQEEHDPKRYRFLDALINDFRDGGKSVNYVCFLYDYFQAFKQFLLTLGRERKKSSNFFLPTSRKFGKPESKVPQVVERNKTAVKCLFEKNIGNLFRFHPLQCFKTIFRQKHWIIFFCLELHQISTNTFLV